MATRTHRPSAIVGGGTAGISVAARLRRRGVDGVAVIDPATTHYYQPLWTLVGGGRAPIEESARPQASVMPKGVTWIRQAAAEIDPDSREITLDDGGTVSYDHLVVCPGIQLDWAKITGLSATLGRDGVSSNYLYELVPATWNFIRNTRSGTAVFGMPGGPIKCAGAPQKIAYLAADHWRREGVLSAIDIHLELPTPGMFGVKEFADVLAGAARRYGITVHFDSEVTEVRPDAQRRRWSPTGRTTRPRPCPTYDVMHLVPPRSAPDWIKKGPLADPNNPAGYVEIDKHTMQHVRYPNVFALGDAGSSPNSKTGAAIRKQAPLELRCGRTPSSPCRRTRSPAGGPITLADGRSHPAGERQGSRLRGGQRQQRWKGVLHDSRRRRWTTLQTTHALVPRRRTELSTEDSY